MDIDAEEFTHCCKFVPNLKQELCECRKKELVDFYNKGRSSYWQHIGWEAFNCSDKELFESWEKGFNDSLKEKFANLDTE